MKFVDGTRAYQILVLNHEGLVTAAVLLVQLHHEALVIGDGELRHREDRALTLFARHEGGYYFKILSDARKIVFAYAGASALAGYESVNWGKKVLHDGSTLHDRDAFIYGGALTLDVECYVADRIALLANLRERCLWGGDTRKFHTQFGVGVKFIIN